MDPIRRVQEEFTRQAETFDAYAPKADLRVEERFREALGAQAGAVLDLACGPGVVTAAVAGIASSVVAFDATPAMLAKARKRCAEAGLANVDFRQGDAAALPFESGAFDAVVTRLAIHHFAQPACVLGELFRVLRPGGKLVIADVTVSERSADAELQNAIEKLRDPSHVRMLPPSEMNLLLSAAGFDIIARSTWDADREFEEWMGIANDPERTQALRVVARTLAASGHSAGMGLSIAGERLVFFHRWILLTALRKPQGPTPGPTQGHTRGQVFHVPAGAAETVVYSGKWLEFCRSEAGWEYVRRRSGRCGVLIMPLTPDGKLLLIEQYRETVRGLVIELPAGLVGDEEGASGEEVVQAARRELEEETGYRSEALQELATGLFLPGLSDEKNVICVARDAVPVDGAGRAGPSPHESIVVHQVPVAQVLDWLAGKQSEGMEIDLRIYAALAFLPAALVRSP